MKICNDLPGTTGFERLSYMAQAMLEDIREALIGFAVTNARLPCPDTNGDGQEDRGLGPVAPNRVCDVPLGNLPWSDLGVPQFDSWGRLFIYRVTGLSFILLVLP